MMWSNNSEKPNGCCHNWKTLYYSERGTPYSILPFAVLTPKVTSPQNK